MGLISFIKEAGEKLFGKGEAKAAQEAAEREANAANLERLNKAAGDAIATYINAMNLKVDGLEVAFDGATGTVTVSGVAADQATKEKVVLCCGNVEKVAAVNDLMTVAKPADESKYYTVVKGDSLSKIAKELARVRPSRRSRVQCRVCSTRHDTHRSRRSPGSTGESRRATHAAAASMRSPITTSRTRTTASASAGWMPRCSSTCRS